MADSFACQDLLGVVRGRCRHPDCRGCDAFTRPQGGYALASHRERSGLFHCMRCGCPSRDHERLSPDQAAPALAEIPAQPGAAAPQQSSSSTAAASREEEQARICVGDLVLVMAGEAEKQSLGLVHSSTCDGTCAVELLRTSSTNQEKAVKTLTLKDVSLEELGADRWHPPRVLGNFEMEANFKDLVFQPGGLHSLVPALKQRRCKLCVLGGSISLQGRGYRPNLVRALERRGVTVEDIPAAVGTAGSKPLSLVVSDWVLTKRPDLLIIEVAVNDGDELLESTPLPDAAGVLRAAEGIVRTVRRRCPSTAILFLEMFLRDDAEARVLKSGSEAWRDSSCEEAIGWYHEVAPRLHRHVCRRYGVTQIDLVPAFRSLSTESRQSWFRDDCHHSDAGGEAVGNLLARLLLWAVRQPALSTLCGSLPRPALPPPLDAQCWCNGRTMRVSPGWLDPPEAVVRRVDKDLLKLGQQTEWLLLHAGGKATLPFKGRACGLMTLLGPDAPSLLVRIDGEAPKRLQLLDRWCYYWRDAVVLLCDGLADATHTAELEVEAEPPDHSILKRPPSSELWSQWSEAYNGAGAQSDGVVETMKVVSDDVKKEIAVAVKEEAESVAEYESMKAKLEKEKESLEETKVKLKMDKGDAEQEKEQTMTERKDDSTSLKGVLKTMDDAKPGCDFYLNNFAARQKNRLTEIKGLDKAKAILKGAVFEDKNRELKAGDS